MTRHIYNLIILFLLAAVVSCNDEKMDVGSSGEHRPIYLSAATNNSVLTRAPYELTEPTTYKPLSVDVWASTTEYLFRNDGLNGTGVDGKVSLHATARFQSSAPQLLNEAIYNETERPRVYFVAMYPQGWTTADGTKALFTINGAQDLMFAPQIYGTYGTPYEQSPQLSFRHLLTWLTFELKAESTEAIAAWGRVRNIEIRSKNSVIVDLSGTAYNKVIDGDKAIYNYQPSGCTYENETRLPLYYKIPTNATEDDKTLQNKFPGGYELTTSGSEVAYVLCAPVNATFEEGEEGNKTKTDEYTLYVETDYRNIEVGIDLKKEYAGGSDENRYFTGSTMGYKFNIQLNFKLGNTIAVTAKMNDWTEGGIINKDVEE